MGLGGAFSSPFLLFSSQQAAVSSSVVVNRAMLLLLLQSPDETNNLAACSSSQIFLFLTSCWQKGTASDSFTSEMKKKKVKMFALILWFEMVETDVKGKGLLSYPQPPPQKHVVFHMSYWVRLNALMCLTPWAIPRSGEDVGVMETAIVQGWEGVQSTSRSIYRCIHLQILMQVRVYIEASVSLTIVINSTNLILHGYSLFWNNKRSVKSLYIICNNC